MAFSISTINGGCQHEYIGMIIPQAQYTLFLNNAKHFAVVTNPRPYPATAVVDPDILIYVSIRSLITKQKSKSSKFTKESKISHTKQSSKLWIQNG
jgi:hypothetical protein